MTQTEQVQVRHDSLIAEAHALAQQFRRGREWLNGDARAKYDSVIDQLITLELFELPAAIAAAK